MIGRITNRLAESFINKMAAITTVDRAAVDWWEALQHARCLAELTQGRIHPGSVFGPGHPFETSRRAMQQRLQRITGIMVTPPPRIHFGSPMAPGAHADG